MSRNLSLSVCISWSCLISFAAAAAKIWSTSEFSLMFAGVANLCMLSAKLLKASTERCCDKELNTEDAIRKKIPTIPTIVCPSLCALRSDCMNGLHRVRIAKHMPATVWRPFVHDIGYQIAFAKHSDGRSQSRYKVCAARGGQTLRLAGANPTSH